jgi:hypothetical protein
MLSLSAEVSACSSVSSSNSIRVTVVSQWCHSGVTVVSQWCHSGVKMVLKWNHSGVTGCCNGVTVVLQWCGLKVVL